MQDIIKEFLLHTNNEMVILEICKVLEDLKSKWPPLKHDFEYTEEIEKSNFRFLWFSLVWFGLEVFSLELNKTKFFLKFYNAVKGKYK